MIPLLNHDVQIFHGSSLGFALWNVLQSRSLELSRATTAVGLQGLAPREVQLLFLQEVLLFQMAEWNQPRSMFPRRSL